jgi:uncharacterized membrane protein
MKERLREHPYRWLLGVPLLVLIAWRIVASGMPAWGILVALAALAVAATVVVLMVRTGDSGARLKQEEEEKREWWKEEGRS